MYAAINSHDLDELLQGFSNLVKRGSYKKFPYDKWKEFTSKFKGKCVELWYDESVANIEVSSNDRKMMLIDPTDDSLGTFLYNECLEDTWYEAGFGKDLVEMKCKVASSEVNKNMSKIDVEKLGVKIMNANGDLMTIDPAYCTTQSTSSDCYPVKNYKIHDLDAFNMPMSSSLKTPIDKMNNKEIKDMKGFNFDFGPCSNDNVRMSMYGLAIQNNAGVWVSYNNGQVIDVDIMNFDGRQYMFKMPVAIKDIKVGDVVVHNRVPMFVTSVEGGVHVVDIRAGEAKTIVPTTNMFGFNFITKIVSMFDAFGTAPTADQPFGNMLPFMLMGDNKDIDPMMMFMMMNGGNFDMSNPMMMYFMFKDGNKGSDMLPMLMMMNMQNQGKHECHCNHDHN